jgi:hypothetical protein
MGINNKTKSTVVIILVALLAGVFLWAVLGTKPTSDHQAIIDHSTIYYYEPASQGLTLLTPVCEKAVANVNVSSLLSTTDIFDIVQRNSLFNKTVPLSVWSFQRNGFACAYMRIMGPYGTSNDRYLVEVSRMTMSKLTITVCGSETKTMLPAMGDVDLVDPYPGYVYFWVQNMTAVD